MANALYDGPAWQRAEHFRRLEYTITFGASSRVVLPINPNRIGFVISAPQTLLNQTVQDGTQGTAIDTSTTGPKLLKSSSASTAEILASASFTETAAAGVVADLEIIRGGNNYKIARVTTAGLVTPGTPLALGDQVQWNVTTAQPASLSDFTITLSKQLALQRITLSVNSPVVDGAGLCIYSGQSWSWLWRDVVGDALTEEIFGIASISGMQIGIWDIFY